MTLTVPLSSGLTSTVSLGNKTQATASVAAVNRAPVCNSRTKVTMIHGFNIVLNDEGCFILFFSLVAAFRHYSRVRVILMSNSRSKVSLPRCPQIKEKAAIVKGIRFPFVRGSLLLRLPASAPNPLDIRDHFPYLPNNCSSPYACLYRKDESGIRFAGNCG